ncbi:MAG: hypothetical protein ACI3VP_00015 [Oscillospiraceae bacterium]
MSREKRQGKVWTYAGVLEILCAIVLLIISSSMRNEYKYSYSSDYRISCKVVTIIGVACAVSGAIDLVFGVYQLSKVGQQPYEMDPASNANLMTCPDCRQAVSRNAKRCPHCGAELEAYIAMMEKNRAKEELWYCGDCGFPNGGEEDICSFCGKKRGGESAGNKQ